MNFIKKSLTLGLTLVAFSSALASTAATAATTATSASVPSTTLLGQVTNNTYQNKFFQFSLNFPKDWHASSQQEMLALNKLGRKIVDEQSHNNQLIKDMQKAAAHEKLSLFQVSSEPMGTPRNTMLRITATKPEIPVKSGAQVIASMKYAMKKVLGFKHVKFTDLPAKDFGKVTFSHLQIVMPVGQINILENFYAGVKKGYVIFITTATTDGSNNKKALQKTIDSISFN